MRNDFKTTIAIRRIDICDLMIACVITKDIASDNGEKWDKLYNMLKTQLDELDNQLDEL